VIYTYTERTIGMEDWLGIDDAVHYIFLCFAIFARLVRVSGCVIFSAWGHVLYRGRIQRFISVCLWRSSVTSHEVAAHNFLDLLKTRHIASPQPPK